MPEVIIYAMEGRSHEQKQGLVRDITDACVKHLDAPEEAVVIQFVECPPSSKSKGGVLFSDMTEEDVKRIFGPGER